MQLTFQNAVWPTADITEIIVIANLGKNISPWDIRSGIVGGSPTSSECSGRV